MSDYPLNINELGDKIQFKTEEVGVTIGSFLQTGFGVFSGVVGLACTVTGISVMADGFQLGWLAFTSLLGVLPLGFGVHLVKDSSKKARARREEIIERKIMKAMLRQNSSVTPQQLAVQMAIPLPLAEKKLEQLFGKGMLEVKISNSGILYYELSEAMRWENKLLR